MSSILSIPCRWFRTAVVVGAVCAITSLSCGYSDPITIVPPDPQFSGRFGTALLPLPDGNGDGKAEILIDRFSGGGKIYEYSGANLDFTRSWTNPNAGARYFGSAMASLPDIDADGIPEIIVGSRGDNSLAGRAYVFSGNAARTLLLTLTAPVPSSGESFGSSVAAIGDLNADGKPDILVGAPHFMSTTQLGRVYVFSGANGACLRTIEAPFPPPTSTNTAPQFGLFVLSVPDLNGDTLPEIIATAMMGDGAGRVYLLSGADATVLSSISGSPATEMRCISPVLLPDMNADGYQELLVGAPGQWMGGCAYIYALAPPGTMTLLNSTIWSSSYDPWNDSQVAGFGYVCAALPDLDGDNKPEFALGAPYNPMDYSAPRGHGRVAIYSTKLPNRYGTNQYAPIKVLRGPELTSPSLNAYGVSFGTALTPVPDLNGDGTPELAVSDWEVDVDTVGIAGKAYMYYTKPSGSISTSSLDFGRWSAAAGPMPLQDVVISNNDVGALNFAPTAYEFSGPDAADFDFASPPDFTPIKFTCQRTIPVRFNPTSFGNKSATLTIMTAENGGTTYTVSLQGTHMSTWVSQTQINYGELAPGAPIPASTVSITNGNATPLNFVGAGIQITGTNAADFTIDPAPSLSPLAPGGELNLNVQFSPVSNGPKTATLTITTDDSFQATYEVALSGYAIWVQPRLGGGEFFDLGAQWLEDGPTAPQDVTVHNWGTSPLSFSGAGMELVGNNATEFRFATAPDLSPIPAGQSRTFAVQFAPTSAGDKKTSLVVSAVNPDEGSIALNISGKCAYIPDRSIYLSGESGVLFAVHPNGDRFVVCPGDPPSYTVPLLYDTVVENRDNVLAVFRRGNNMAGVMRIFKKTGARTVLFEYAISMAYPMPGCYAMALETSRSLIAADHTGLIRMNLDTLTTQSVVTFPELFATSGARTGPAAYTIMSMALEPDGNILYQSSIYNPAVYSNTPRLRRINPTTKAIAQVTTATIYDFALERSGSIVATYKVEAEGYYGSTRLARINPHTGAMQDIATIAPQGTYINPTGLAVDADGSIVVYLPVNVVSKPILRFDPITGAQTTISQYPNVGSGPNLIANTYYYGPAFLTVDLCDTDGDGTPDYTEDQQPDGGDGNDDSEPDKTQANVMSIPAPVGGGYLTLVGPAGSSFAASTVASQPRQPIASGGALSFGEMTFRLDGVPVGGLVDITVNWTGSAVVSVYWKLVSGNWETLSWNGTTGVVSMNPAQKTLTVRVQDGGRGDQDGVANGSVVDPGGPGVTTTGAADWSLFM